MVLYCSVLFCFWHVPSAFACPGWKTLLDSSYLLYFERKHWSKPWSDQTTCIIPVYWPIFYFLSLPLLTFNLISPPNCICLPTHPHSSLLPPPPAPSFICLHLIWWCGTYSTSINCPSKLLSMSPPPPPVPLHDPSPPSFSGGKQKPPFLLPTSVLDRSVHLYLRSAPTLLPLYLSHAACCSSLPLKMVTPQSLFTLFGMLSLALSLSLSLYLHSFFLLSSVCSIFLSVFEIYSYYCWDYNLHTVGVWLYGNVLARCYWFGLMFLTLL